MVVEHYCAALREFFADPPPVVTDEWRARGELSALSSRAGVAGDALSALGKGGLAAAAGLGAV